MPPKKTAAAKRARSPAGDAEPSAATTVVDLPPITWPHTQSTPSLWMKEDSLLYLDLHTKDSYTKKYEDERKAVRVAGFDMDDTLVMSKTGKVFAEGRSDWKLLHPAVAGKLLQLHRDGHRVVIFSNQSGIGGKGWKEEKASEIRGKIVDIGNSLSIPISAWVSTTEDKYRKPGLGMWEHYCAKLPHPVDMANSFYCGDAAGRKITTLAGRKKDFSCGDRKFAVNAKLPFFTPEEYFAGLPPTPTSEVDWDGVSEKELKELPTTYPQATYHKPGLECVIFVGFPGSGKSTFFSRFFAAHGYLHVNRDTFKDMAKCVKATEDSLKAGKSCVIDNTNPNADDRKPFVDLAKKYGATLRAIHFTASKELAFHMNVMRDRLGITPRVSSIAYNIFKGKFQEPSASEGFAEIVKVPPVADFTGLPAGAQSQFFMLT